MPVAMDWMRWRAWRGRGGGLEAILAAVVRRGGWCGGGGGGGGVEDALLELGLELELGASMAGKGGSRLGRWRQMVSGGTCPYSIPTVDALTD